MVAWASLTLKDSQELSGCGGYGRNGCHLKKFGWEQKRRVMTLMASFSLHAQQSLWVVARGRASGIQGAYKAAGRKTLRQTSSKSAGQIIVQWRQR